MYCGTREKSSSVFSPATIRRSGAETEVGGLPVTTMGFIGWDGGGESWWCLRRWDGGREMELIHKEAIGG